MELRPTPDRVRETLFNWLQPVIKGMRCLDLYAGSGALGFEALSRGATSVTMVEKNRGNAETLLKQARTLEAVDVDIVCDDAMHYLASSSARFDLVFVDPPYSKNILQSTCESLLNSGNLRSEALVYVESDGEIASSSAYTVRKRARAGKVHFMLLGISPGGQPENDNSYLSGHL